MAVGRGFSRMVQPRWGAGGEQSFALFGEGAEGWRWFDRIALRILLVSLALAVAAFLTSLLIESFSGRLTPFDRLAYPFMTVLLLGGFVALLLRPGLLPLALLGSNIGVALFLLLKLFFLLFVLPGGGDGLLELTESFFWVPVVYLLAFLSPWIPLGRGVAALFTVAVFLLSLAFALPAAFQGRGWGVVHGLVQMNFANLIMLGLAVAFIRLRHRFSETQAKIDVVEKLAYTDLLTGLPNRLRLHSELDRMIASAQQQETRLAVLFIDLDGFKAINDSLGHESGDVLLVQVAERFRHRTRRDDLVARLSGDEFVVVAFPVDDAGGAYEVAQKLQASLAEPFALAGQRLSLSASIGVCLFPDDATDGAALLRNADSAMYRVKRSGRNGICHFSGSTDVGTEQRRSLERDLKAGLQEHLALHYQPQYDLASGQMLKLEALVRWNHPRHGVIAPGEFLPLAEESGLILPIGAWVIREACRQARALAQFGLGHIRVSTNVSAFQIMQPNFVEGVQTALGRSGIEPGQLELEVPESVVIHQSKGIAATLGNLRQLGVGLAIDDFGTGYSSLAALRDLPFTAVKIDRALVRDLGRKPELPFTLALVEAIVRLAQSLDLQVVAGGIETQEQADLLRRLGCGLGQGFWFARPMAMTELQPQLVAARRRMPPPVAEHDTN